MSFRTIIPTLALAMGASCIHANEPSREYAFHHEHVLGSSLELRLHTDSHDLASSAEEAVLAEIDRLAKVLSRHDAESELMRWQSGSADDGRPVSEDLANVLERAEHWRQQSAGAFDVRAGALAAGAAKATQEARQSSVRQLASRPYTLTASSEGAQSAAK